MAAVIEKREVSVEGLNRAVATLVPENIAKTLILGGGEPKATMSGQFDLPGEFLLAASASANSKKEGKIFTNDNVAAVHWIGQKPHEQATVELKKVGFWTWFYDNQVMNGEHELEALSAGAIVLTSDNKIVLQLRSNEVALGEGRISVPSSFVTKKPKGEEFGLRELLPEIMGKNIGIRKIHAPEFIGFFEDNSLYKNNIMALYAAKVRLSADEVRAELPSATCAGKTAGLEFVENGPEQLQSYIAENLEKMMPHTKLGLLAYGYARWGENWVAEVEAEVKRNKFREFLQG